MIWGVLIVLVLPLVLALVAAWIVLQMAVLLVRLIFLALLWLSRQPRRQRVELYRYEWR
jgi:uncharacterized membrane protein